LAYPPRSREGSQLKNTLIGFAILAGIIAFALGAGIPGAAQAPVTVGLDVDTEGNSGASLGARDACRRVGVGDSLEVDVFITDVPALGGAWQANVSYDPDVVNITGADISDLFQSQNGDQVVEGSDEALPDADGIRLIAAFDLGPDDSGSGVLERLTLKAVGKGVSPLTMEKVQLAAPLPPGGFNPGETGSIGDTDGDSYFDGRVFQAAVAVDEDCSEVPTPSAVTGTPQPTGSRAPTSTPVRISSSDPDIQAILDDALASSGASGSGYIDTALQKLDDLPDSAERKRVRGLLEAKKKDLTSTAPNDDDGGISAWAIAIGLGVVGVALVAGGVTWSRTRRSRGE
jgi:hypothetical protein